MANIDDDNVRTRSENTPFEEVLETRMSRRSLFGRGFAAAAVFSLGGVEALLRAVPASAHGRPEGTNRSSVFTAFPSPPPTQRWSHRDTRQTC